jgi:hypothetical protein
LPATPVRSINANGITGYDLYEADVEISSNKIPAVSASSSDRNVKIAITQAKTVYGTAIVKFDYEGVVKTCKINFVNQINKR